MPDSSGTFCFKKIKNTVKYIDMKLKTKIKLIVLIFAISALLSFILFIVFYNDPFIKFAPKDTKIYSLININQKIKEENISKVFSLRNISINKILENKEFKKIKSDYIGKISFFITEDNNYYIVLKQKLFKKNIYNIDTNNLSLEINKYTNLNINLKSYKFDRYIILTNSNNVDNLISNKYIFFIDNYKKLILNREFYFILNQNILKIYADSYYLNNIIKDLTNNQYYDYFVKDYSVMGIKLLDNTFNIYASNLNNSLYENNYSTNYLKDNYLIINNINISTFVSTFIEKYKNQDIKAGENLNYLFKNISEDGFDINSIKKIFSNNSSLFLNFKDSRISLNNIDSFLILTKLDNFNNYIDDINSLEKVFLTKSCLNSPKVKIVVLPDGTLAKEELLNCSNTKFKTKDISKNNISYTIKYIDYNNYKIYYSMINKDGTLLVSNNEEMISDVYSKFINYSFALNNLNINILANIKQNNLNINIK